MQSVRKDDGRHLNLLPGGIQIDLEHPDFRPDWWKRLALLVAGIGMVIVAGGIVTIMVASMPLYVDRNADVSGGYSYGFELIFVGFVVILVGVVWAQLIRRRRNALPW